MTATHLLSLDDIADQRAYERERDDFRREVIAVKKLRRVSIGPVITLTFESRMTMRFQVQEMARAEKMVTDEQIQHELDVYNRLLPSPGELSATLFLELTNDQDLRKWLPLLVGIESACELRIGTGETTSVVTSTPEGADQSHLTREESTSAVHYVRFLLTDRQVAGFSTQPLTLAVSHPSYPDGHAGVALSEATRAELAGDLVAR